MLRKKTWVKMKIQSQARGLMPAIFSTSEAKAGGVRSAGAIQ